MKVRISLVFISKSFSSCSVASGNFRTVVKVGDDHPVDNDAGSVYSDKTGSGMPSSETSRGILRGAAPASNPVPASGGWTGGKPPLRRNSSGDAKDARGSANVSRSNSFQVQAQNVLKAFDDIVEEELNGGGGSAEGAAAAPSRNTGRNSALMKSPSPTVPPAPPPPPPLPPASG